MKKTFTRFATGAMIVALGAVAMPTSTFAKADPVTGWGDFKIYLDPGHSGRENQGIWGYSEAEKTLAIALKIQQMFKEYTDMPEECLKICRYDANTSVGLEERTDEANAWGADFYYSIHSDAGATVNTIVLLFGGWRNNGVEIEKTPNGGKHYGEILDPNLSGVMRIGSRGNWYDRCFYYRGDETHENQYPYLSVNRRSHMPSLLSEGGYHTMAEQQQRNMNVEYKHLEAFAAFQSLMQYHEMPLPQQTWLHGVISNSENGQPINGATVTVKGTDLTYTTDTYESLFSKYTRNENLIHNGLYTFEDVLEAGKEYTLEFSAPGFETLTTTVTIAAGGATSPDYVTFCDVALTNASPAIVASVSCDNIEAVEIGVPMTLTFSRNMDRASVEQALSIDNDGQIELTWQNDYTLDINVDALEAEWEYTITIDGSVARNSQTNQLLDGDADGVEGGDYVLTFVMAAPDEENPYVVATYPEDGGEALYHSNPPIRFEFNEVINWNDENNQEWIVVTDSKGTQYTGTITHDIINGASVLHFLTKEPFASDVAVCATVKGGLLDKAGNASAQTSIRFLTEYRNQLTETVVETLEDAGTFWAPNGSGSSKGWIGEEVQTYSLPVAPYANCRSSWAVDYSFDENDAGQYWFLRIHDPKGSNVSLTKYDGTLTMWVYGDGSNNNLNLMFRHQSTMGIFHRKNDMPIDFRGWNLFVWDIPTDEWEETLTNNGVTFKRAWYIDAISWRHEMTDIDDEEVPYQLWKGTFACHDLRYTTWDNNAERQANINDVAIPNDLTGVETIATEANESDAVYFNLQGIRMDASNLTPGIYVRINGGVATKVVVK